MNKTTLFIGAVLLSLTGIVSCGPSAAERAEQARQDSIRVADSIAKVEAERAEQARLDSLRTDSLIRASIPQMKDLIGVTPEYNCPGVVFNDFAKISKILKNKGLLRWKISDTSMNTIASLLVR